MSYIFKNPNPSRKLIGDCVIRAISIAEQKTWHDIFVELMIVAYNMSDLPSSNQVWGQYLRNKGYIRYPIPNTCPDCYTVMEFAEDNKKGTFIVATGTHVVAVIDGDYLDTWDSGDEVPVYYWVKEN